MRANVIHALKKYCNCQIVLGDARRIRPALPAILDIFKLFKLTRRVYRVLVVHFKHNRSNRPAHRVQSHEILMNLLLIRQKLASVGLDLNLKT